jgi:hypothetical protein
MEESLAMNAKRLYELLEQQSLRLDEEGDDDLAERIRSVMDFIWYGRLTGPQREALNARTAVLIAPETSLFLAPATLPPPRDRQPVVTETIPFSTPRAA